MNLIGDALDRGLRGRRGRAKRKRAVRVGRVDSIENQSVKMGVEVEAPAETLGKIDGPAVGTLHTGARPQLDEDLLHEDAPQRGQHLRVEGRQATQLPRQREHPLPDRHVGEHAVDQMSRLVRHSASATGWAQPSALARKGYEDIVPARVAMEAQKAGGEPSALKVRAELGFDVPRERLLVVNPRVVEEGFEVALDDAVHRRRPRRARSDRRTARSTGRLDAGRLRRMSPASPPTRTGPERGRREDRRRGGDGRARGGAVAIVAGPPARGRRGGGLLGGAWWRSTSWPSSAS